MLIMLKMTMNMLVVMLMLMLVVVWWWLWLLRRRSEVERRDFAPLPVTGHPTRDSLTWALAQPRLQ